MIEVLYQLGSRSGVCSQGVLSEHPGFPARSVGTHIPSMVFDLDSNVDSSH
jgi:hypothetical protein